MLYYSYAITIFAGIMSTPITSLISKCVDRDEFGKIFTLTSNVEFLAFIGTDTLIKVLYEATLDTFPGAMYFLYFGIDGVVLGLLMSLYIILLRNENRHGPLHSLDHMPR